jgi:hypothetical protein
MKLVYEDADPLWDKVTKIARRVYRAAEVTADAKVRSQIRKLQDDGYGHYPVCVAKTQYSFSTDASLRGAPSGHSINVREVRLAAGARRRENEGVALLRAENLLQAREQRLHQVREGRRTMVFRGDGHGAHDAVGKIGRARHEEEVFAGDSGILHFLLLVEPIGFRR